MQVKEKWTVAFTPVDKWNCLGEDVHWSEDKINNPSSE